MDVNINTLKLYYALDIKKYARLRKLSKEEAEDLVKKTRYLFGLGPSADVEKFITYWSPEDFIEKVDYEVDRICEEFMDILED